MEITNLTFNMMHRSDREREFIKMQRTGKIPVDFELNEIVVLNNKPSRINGVEKNCLIIENIKSKELSVINLSSLLFCLEKGILSRMNVKDEKKKLI